jgi:hypothetical protein
VVGKPRRLSGRANVSQVRRADGVFQLRCAAIDRDDLLEPPREGNSGLSISCSTVEGEIPT